MNQKGPGKGGSAATYADSQDAHGLPVVRASMPQQAWEACRSTALLVGRSEVAPSMREFLQISAAWRHLPERQDLAQEHEEKYLVGFLF